jgi:hypothetical protein
VLRTLCAGEQDERAPAMAGLIWGAVTDAVTGAPLRDVEVWADWLGPPRDGAGTVRQRFRTARTDADGRYNLCWMPETAEVTLRVRAGRNWVDATTLELIADSPPIRRHDFLRNGGG